MLNLLHDAHSIYSLLVTSTTNTLYNYYMCYLNFENQREEDWITKWDSSCTENELIHTHRDTRYNFPLPCACFQYISVMNSPYYVYWKDNLCQQPSTIASRGCTEANNVYVRMKGGCGGYATRQYCLSEREMAYWWFEYWLRGRDLSEKSYELHSSTLITLSYINKIIDP